MKILVTDPEGYIGSLLVPSLKQQGYEVESISLTSDYLSHAVTNWQDIEVAIYATDICSIPGLHPQIACNIHHQNAIHLASLAKAAGVRRFIYLSSCGVYGAGEEDYVTEESAVRPQTPYAACKVAIENDLLAIASAEFSPTILRPAVIFGASPRIRFDVVLNNMAGFAWTTNKINIPGNGLAWFPLVHVLDVCQAIDRILHAPRRLVHQQIFNVGDTNLNCQLIEIAATVAEVFQVDRFNFGHPNFSDRGLFVTFDKMQQFFPNFHCSWTPRQGTEQLLNFFTLTDSIQSNFGLVRSPHRQPKNYAISTASIA